MAVAKPASAPQPKADIESPNAIDADYTSHERIAFRCRRSHVYLDTLCCIPLALLDFLLQNC